MPQTVRHYSRAQQDVYGCSGVYVPKTRYNQFTALERRLFRAGIVPVDYAYGLSGALKGWVTRNTWKYLPINIFCGQWAVDYFTEEIGNWEYHPPDYQKEQQALLLYDELLVARMYIENGGDVTFHSTVEMLNPMLTPEWLWLYKTTSRTSLRVQALDMLSEEYGVYAIHYEDLFQEH